MPWGEVLDWLQANWLGLLTLVVVSFGAFTTWRHFRRSTRDVTPQVYFLTEEDRISEVSKVHQRGDSPSCFPLRIAVVNLGGSDLKHGTLTVTLEARLEALDSPGWEDDQPNALIEEGTAVRHDLPTIGRNDRASLSPLFVTISEPPHQGSGTYRVRWEVWSGDEGLGSADLELRYRLLEEEGRPDGEA